MKRVVLVLCAWVCGHVFADLPLEGDTTLEFTTTTATWLSFDLSPDGSTFVLEVLGDLYTLSD